MPSTEMSITIGALGASFAATTREQARQNKTSRGKQYFNQSLFNRRC
jgi:hypothetical protein